MYDQLNKTLNELGLSELLSLFEGQDIDDSVLGDLSDADLKDIGIDKLGTRKKLLAAFGKPGGGGTATASVAEQSAPQRGLSAAPPTTATTPAEATKDSPWVNTLGMPFVPIPRFDTRFCIWPARVQDYEAYCMASGAKFPVSPFPQESDHPIVGVSWNDAIEFCVWLTGKERSEGKIDERTVYRLPTDLEWSAAVGLPHEPEATPAERHLKADGYPWGLRWPPPRDSGNYEHTRRDQLELSARCDLVEKVIGAELDHFNSWLDERGRSGGVAKERMLDRQQAVADLRRIAARWVAEWTPIDTYEFTSAVEAFGPNDFGLYGLGGNAWEWCMDDVGTTKQNDNKIARGGSFSMCPINGLSNTREARESSKGLSIECSVVYRSSYRHTGSSGALTSSEYGTLTPNEWNEVPCGGFRIVVTNC